MDEVADPLDFVLRVLAFFEEIEAEDYLSWQVHLGRRDVRFWVRCNDLFDWGTADDEPVTPENFGLLKPARRDTLRCFGREVPVWALRLFCARSRGQRPQRLAYPKSCPEFVALLDACGPERD